MSGPRLWLRVLLGVALLAGLAWQGRHFAQLLPQIDALVANLGVWGPTVFIACVALLSPLLFPDSPLGLVAGFVFGLGAGTLYYLGTIYVVNLGIFALGRTRLREPILRFAAGRPKAEAILGGARRQAVRLTLLIRLVPVNAALVSYLLGAARFPWRAVVIGNFALFPHMFLVVYIGRAAHHVTRRAGQRQAGWEFEGVMLLVGLAAAAAVVLILARIANKAIADVEAESRQPPPEPR